MLGKALFGLSNWRIVGVPVSDSIEYFHKELRELERETTRQFKLNLAESDTPIDLLEGYIGEGYAIPTPEAIETTRKLAKMEGILLDPTYTSKGMTGTIDAIKQNKVRDGAIPVFIHTGGVFGLFARRDLFS
jgi:D-cysteine desulfhydrase